ncbi:hypothetical protein D3C87_1705910 [compost metagenome]
MSFRPTRRLNTSEARRAKVIGLLLSRAWARLSATVETLPAIIRSCQRRLISTLEGIRPRSRNCWRASRSLEAMISPCTFSPPSVGIAT